MCTFRELLWTLSKEELWLLEKSLCSAEEQGLYRDLDNVPFPDDFDPYHDLSIDPADFALDGAAMGLPGGLADGEGSTLDCDQFLNVVPYGCMSQSPSTMTLVANADAPPVSEDSLEDADCLDRLASCQRLYAAKQNMPHQDSADSGMLSENGSTVTAGCEAGQRGRRDEGNGGGVREARSLRHSVSWPEATLRPRRGARYHDTDSAGLGFFDDSVERAEGAGRPACTHSHEFNFHLPLNTETTSDRPPVSRPRDTTPTNAVDLGSTRVFYTSDCCEEDQCLSQQGNQISYVTETLNEVFVTDTSAFQQSFISAVTSKALSESMGICCKCGNKTCGATTQSGWDQSGRGQSGTGRSGQTNNEGNRSQSVDQMNEVNTSTGDESLRQEINTEYNTQGDQSRQRESVTMNTDQDSIEVGMASASHAEQSETLDLCTVPISEEGQEMIANDHQVPTTTTTPEETMNCEHQGQPCSETTGGSLVNQPVSPTSSEEEKANVEPSEKESESGLTQPSPDRQVQCRCKASCDNNQDSVGDGSSIDMTLSLEGVSDCKCLRDPCDKGEPCVQAGDLCSKADQALRTSLEVPRVQRLRYADGVTMMCSACNRSRRSSVNSVDVDWDRER